MNSHVKTPRIELKTSESSISVIYVHTKRHYHTPPALHELSNSDVTIIDLFFFSFEECVYRCLKGRKKDRTG